MILEVKDGEPIAEVVKTLEALLDLEPRRRRGRGGLRVRGSRRDRIWRGRHDVHTIIFNLAERR